MSITVILFGILAIMAIASAVVTISTKHPVRAAMALIVHFFMLAGLYLTLQAQFIAVLQILVYAGAIMVLVVFVIMLLNLGNDEYLKSHFKTKQMIGIALSISFTIVIITALASSGVISNFPNIDPQITTAQSIGKDLYTDYVFPVQAIAILLLGAIVGAVILAKKNIKE